MWRLKLVEQEK